MTPDNQEKNDITYKYVIPDNLEDCFVNGVWGAVSPKGYIHMHLYSERLPLPQMSVHNVKNGIVEDQPSKIESGGDILRLVQSSVVMDISTAIALQKWLTGRIEYFIEMKKEEEKDADTK